MINLELKTRLNRPPREKESQAVDSAYSCYTILTEPHYVNKKKLKTEWSVSEYLKNTDALIGKMDGTIPLKQVDAYGDLPPPSSVIYLDKSARPVEWMVRSLWFHLARTPGTPYAQADIPSRPQSYFLNIDKKDWLRRMGIPEKYIEDAPESLIDFSKIDKHHLSRIRAIYSTRQINEENLEDAWQYPTKLDGQHAMVVDEVKSSGQTLKIAQKLLSLAIPEATFSGQHWATPNRTYLNKGLPDSDGNLQFSIDWVPIWYNPDDASGRDVGDRDFSWPEIAKVMGHSPSRFREVGRYVLSTPPHDPSTYELATDERGKNLRDDIKRLSIHLAQKKLFFRPGSRRNDEDAIERIEALNGISFLEWRKKRDALAPR